MKKKCENNNVDENLLSFVIMKYMKEKNVTFFSQLAVPENVSKLKKINHTDVLIRLEQKWYLNRKFESRLVAFSLI